MTFPHQSNHKILLDTNVILFDPLAMTKFEKGIDIYIPLSVIEEIDQFKRNPGEIGRNARHFSRFCNALMLKGSLAKGIPLQNGSQKKNSYLYVITDKEELSLTESIFSSPNEKRRHYKVDQLLLHTALRLKKSFPQSKIELITKDINLRIKADVFGVRAKDYDPVNISSEEMYKGFTQLDISNKELQDFYEKKSLLLKEGSSIYSQIQEKERELYPNEYIVFKDICNSKQSALSRFIKDKNSFAPLASSQDILGIHPRNMEQSFALDGLLNDDIFFVSLVGKAGTGKTLLALAVGLFKILKEHRFQKLLVSRPIFPMGRDIGYLPGDVEDKLNPWMQPIFDNIEFLMGSDKKASSRTKELLHQGIVNIEPLTYIRGRSIPNQFFIIDEAQNLTPHEIKTIITRAGEGTKVVLTGDSSQIDHPYIDKANSGLTHSVECFKEEELAAHVRLSKGERSKLAELAANLL